MPDMIKLSELRRMLQDPEVTDEEISPYLLDDSENAEAFSPELRPNPHLVEGVTPLEGDVLLGVFNGRSRKRRQRAYSKKIDAGWDGIKIVSDGDSWFQYPIKLDDVIDQLFDRYAIFSLGGAGELLSDMIARDEITPAVRDKRPHALLLSGGGNDMVGDNRIAAMLNPGNNQTAQKAPNANFDTFLKEIEDLYFGLFQRLQGEFPELKIFLHGYDRVLPHNGKWLGRPMAAINITDTNLQREIGAVLIDRLNERLRNLAGRFPGMVSFVDCRGAVFDESWYDELHPKNAGYARVAGRFKDAIDSAVGTS